MKLENFGRTLTFIGLMILGGAVFAAMNPFRVFNEATGSNSSMIRVAPTYIDARVLAANVAEVVTPPSGARWVLFSANCGEWYARPGAAGAVPAADVTDGTASELNPTAWQVIGVATIGVIATTTCVVTLSFYV